MKFFRDNLFLWVCFFLLGWHGQKLYELRDSNQKKIEQKVQDREVLACASAMAKTALFMMDSKKYDLPDCDKEYRGEK